MENENPKSSSREKKRSEQGKMSRKEKKSKPVVASTKSKKRSSKMISPKEKHSKESEDVIAPSNNTQAEGATIRSTSRVSEDGDVREEFEAASERGESPSKRTRSKSRSRSGSRSRFSSFFRRKKRSMSETELNNGSNAEERKRFESAEDVKSRSRQNVLQNSGDVEEETGTLLRSSLKQLPSHRLYDSRIQPRDRLLNMTVADAVKEQRLRRANSAHRSPRRRDTPPSVSSTMYMSSPSLSSTLVDLNSSRSGVSPSTQSATLPVMMRYQQGETSSHTRFLYPQISKTRSDENSDNTNVLPNDFTKRPNLGKDPQRQDISKPPKTGVASRRRQHTDKLSHKPKSNTSEDFKNKIHPGSSKVLVDGNISPEENSLCGVSRDSSDPSEQAPKDAAEAKIKRKASLSKFLELRQTRPSATRTHRMSQSSDSGVTSRDASPAALIATTDAQKRPQEIYKPPYEAKVTEKSVNPYVVSSSPIPQTLTTPPIVSINGAHLQAQEATLPIVKDMSSSIKLDESLREPSSASSSPQVNSLTSSFRSSDQGYVDSDSDDEASFSTPPEEVEGARSGKREKASRTFYPGVLQRKLLETSKGQSHQRAVLPESDLESWDAKRGSNISKAKAEGNLEQDHLRQGKFIEQTKAELRYIPRGVRRSRSDVDSRSKPNEMFPKKAEALNGTRQRTGSADTFSTSPNLGREKVKFDLDVLSAASTTTLVIQDESVTSNSDILLPESGHQKMVPSVGTVAQQRYRRTYSPSSVSKVILTPNDETGEYTAPGASASPLEVNSEREPAPSIPVSIQLHPAHDLPETPASNSPRKIDQVVGLPKRGILKSPVRDRTSVTIEDDSEASFKSETSTDSKPKTDVSVDCKSKTDGSTDTKPKTGFIAATKPKTEFSVDETQKTEFSDVTKPRTEFIVPTKLKTDNNIATTPISEIFQDPQIINTALSIPIPNSKPEMSTTSVPISPLLNAAVPQDININSTSASSEATSDGLKRKGTKPLIDFPLIHGLEVGMHRVHTFSGCSLTDYLREHSKVHNKSETQRNAAKGKEGKSSKINLKKKAAVNDENKTRVNENSTLKKDGSERATKSSPLVEHTTKPFEDEKLKIMVDKECQTSAWLINSLVRKKTAKVKKKVNSFSKKKKKLERRGSTVSDTFIPAEMKRHKESLQRSSLGDIRTACSSELVFPKKGERRLAVTSLNVRGSSVRSIPKHTKTRRFEEESINAEPFLAGTSNRSNVDNKSVDTSQWPKPKKLSLTAVILLKNRLAKFRDRKRIEKATEEIIEDEPSSLSRVPSDTLITIENELNLSKLEISKETDIIDDDSYEIDFSLGYTRKHLRFEHLPQSELMQGEEPLPPLPHLGSRRMRQRRESTLRERKRKCVQYCKKFIAFLFSHIGLCSLVIAYTILGGFIFQALEDQAENTVRTTIRLKRETVVGQLVSLAVEFQKTEHGMQNLSDEVNNTILEYQVFIHKITKDKGWDGVEGADEVGLWTFASSLLYAITVTTTIGYGHVAPKTPEGRIVTMGYAVVGIPLTLLCLTNIGDVMATGFRLLYGKICCGVCCTLFKPRRRRIQIDLEKGLGGPIVTTDEEQPDKPKEVIHVPTSLCLLLIAGYIFAGAMLFSIWEKWDILTGSYFCFITLSTIGFGDIVPGMDSNAWAAEEKLVLCALYLVLGLSLIAMCFNLVQEDVKAKCRWLGMKLGIVEKHETPM